MESCLRLPWKIRVNAEANDKTPQDRSYLENAACVMVYYAAERTLMAWVRAALGMMALGFVIDRFGLVLRMMPGSVSLAHHPTIYSFWTGAVLVFGGSATAIVAAIRYAGLERRFRREGCGAPGHGLPLGVFFTLFVACTGIAIGIFLATVRY
jgi:putative membrane protein